MIFKSAWEVSHTRGSGVNGQHTSFKVTCQVTYSSISPYPIDHSVQFLQLLTPGINLYLSQVTGILQTAIALCQCHLFFLEVKSWTCHKHCPTEPTHCPPSPRTCAQPSWLLCIRTRRFLSSGIRMSSEFWQGNTGLRLCLCHRRLHERNDLVCLQGVGGTQHFSPTVKDHFSLYGIAMHYNRYL